MNREMQVISALLLIIVFIAVGAVMQQTAAILLPLIIAVLLSFVLSPLVDMIVRIKVPRILAIVVIILLLLAIAFGLSMIIYSSAQSLMSAFPEYQQRVQGIISDIIDATGLPDDILSEFNLMQAVAGLAASFSGGLLEFLGSLVMTMIFLFFLLMEKPFMRRKVTDAMRGQDTKYIWRIIAHMNQQIGRYLSIKLFVSLLTSVIVAISFRIVGVDFVLIWALLTFLFNFIPSIGSILITLVASLFAFLQFFPAWGPFLGASISMAVTQLLIGNVLDPKMQGDSLNLSPVVILFSLLFWGWLWGVMGMFLAVPLTVAIKIIFEHIPSLHWIGIMMGTGNFKDRHRMAQTGKPGYGKDGHEQATSNG